MTMIIVTALSPICTCTCVSRCCHLVVAEMVMVTMAKTMAMLHVWWLPTHVGAQLGQCHSTPACTQRWLYGWCMALAGKSSSRITITAE